MFTECLEYGRTTRSSKITWIRFPIMTVNHMLELVTHVRKLALINRFFLTGHPLNKIRKNKIKYISK